MDSSSSSTSFSSKNMSENIVHQSPESVPVGSPSSGGQLSFGRMETDCKDGVRHRGGNQLSEPVNSSSTASCDLAHGMRVDKDAAPYPDEQYAWLVYQQQMYFHYMIQYMHYYQYLYISSQSFEHLMSPSSLTQQQATDAPPPLSQQEQQQPQAQEVAAVNNGVQDGARWPNIRINAQGRMEEEEDDDEELRDWLYHIYFFFRALMLIGIIIFYSDIPRFIAVFCGCLAIYLLQRLRHLLQLTQQVQQQAAQAPQQEQAVQAPQQEQAVQAQQQQADVRPEVVQGEAQPPEAGGQAGENAGGRIKRTLIFICNTVQAFFSSLIPTPPELLEQN